VFCVVFFLFNRYFLALARASKNSSSERGRKESRRVEDEMAPLRSLIAFLLAFLMLVFFSSSSMGTFTTRAEEEALEDSEVERDEEGRSANNLLIDPFRSTSCLDAQMYCEQTIAPAVDQDASLGRFLREERKEAERTQSWEAVVPEERMKAMKVPETLALGAFVDVVVLLFILISSILTDWVILSFFHSFFLSLFLSLSVSRFTHIVSFARMLPSFRRVRGGSRRSEREPKARRAHARRSG
jgi:hypothetical protein